MSDKISGKFHPIPSTLNFSWFFVVSMATAAILKILLKRCISIRNIIIYLETKFRPNRRIFVLWRPFLVQNHRVYHSKPKWSPYGAAYLTPSKIHFHWNLFIFEFLTIFFDFYIGGHLDNFKKKRAQLWVMIFFRVKFQKNALYVWIKKKLHLGYHGNGRHFEFVQPPTAGTHYGGYSYKVSWSLMKGILSNF